MSRMANFPETNTLVTRNPVKRPFPSAAACTETHHGYERGLGEKEALIQRALRSGFAFFGALDDLRLAALHRASCQEAEVTRIR